MMGCTNRREPAPRDGRKGKRSVENRKSVVVVVQDLFTAIRLTDALRAMGYRGLTVQDEQELRSMLTEERPHLVILDLQADGVRPHVVVRAAREAVPGRIIPVLAFAPHTDPKRREDALHAGVHRVVSKSLMASELPQLVRSILTV
jgi:CheY-like chemotaxis protein